MELFDEYALGLVTCFAIIAKGGKINSEKVLNGFDAAWEHLTAEEKELLSEMALAMVILIEKCGYIQTLSSDEALWCTYMKEASEIYKLSGKQHVIPHDVLIRRRGKI